MTFKLADNIISPLGFTTEANYQSLKEGRSGLQRYEKLWNLPEPVVASLLNRELVEAHFAPLSDGKDYTFFEKIAILSASTALAQTSINAASTRVIFILSTTKGNVHLLAEPKKDYEEQPSPLLGCTAKRIAQYFNNPNDPIVVSNACTSGVCAQIEAMRLLEQGQYDYAVVIGADIQSPFIVSGFQSFKALSDESCRPFDASRKGLNLGEAATTIVYTTQNSSDACWQAVRGAIRNDANHISGPSRTGEGSFLALQSVLGATKAEDLAVVSLHGTATNYNDEMESIALSRAGLSQVPVSGLKGYYGHTMGAAGILETILTMTALDQGCLLGTRGYESQGTSCPLNISAADRTTNRTAFVKLLSGFGGCNAALYFEKKGKSQETQASNASVQPTLPAPQATLTLTPTGLTINGIDQQTTATGHQLLTELYSHHIGDYPKFYKMDPLSRLGFVASELLLASITPRPQDPNTSVLFMGRAGSLANDNKYQATIQDPENFFPSPALFVYTLPNIVTGEIAIRNHFYGETNYLLLDHYDESVMRQCIQAAIADTTTLLTGWVDCTDEEHFEANLQFYTL